MQHLLDIGQIEARAQAINLPLAKLARMATVNKVTAWRAKNGTDPRASTLRRLTETLERQEDKLRRHLDKLERSGGGRQIDIFDVKAERNAR
jgi:predicted transcriptional regulator